MLTTGLGGNSLRAGKSLKSVNESIEWSRLPNIWLSNLYNSEFARTAMTSSQHVSRMMRIRRHLGDPGYRNRLSVNLAVRRRNGNQPMTKKIYSRSIEGI